MSDGYVVQGGVNKADHEASITGHQKRGVEGDVNGLHRRERGHGDIGT